MKNVKSVTLESHLNVLENLKYGENLIIYDSEKSKKITSEKIKVLNAYFGGDVIYQRKPSYVELNDGSFSNNVGNVTSLVYAKLNQPIPLLHDDNYIGEKILNETVEFENISRHLNIDVRLRKYYRNLGLILNVKFRENRFDATNRKGGKPKKVGSGIATQIREAYLNGEKSICFSSYRSNLQSIRNAASSFGKMVDKRFNVEVHGYEIFVIFREFTENEKKELEFKNIIMSLKKIDTKEHITALFHEFLDFEFPEETDSENDTDDIDNENAFDEDVNESKTENYEPEELDTRFDEDDDEDHEPTKYNWDDDNSEEF